MKASRVYVNSVLAALADLGWKDRTLAWGCGHVRSRPLALRLMPDTTPGSARGAGEALVLDPRSGAQPRVWSILVEATLGPKATLFRKRLTSWFRRAVPPTAGEARA